MAFTDMDDLRTQRNAALAASDFAMLDDSPYDPMRKLAISLYRQELRDLPEMVDQDDLENAELPDSIL
tara:strand:- start:1345 stop:1548 length:204 start_codon:yes stop_codon:yes gene_type:complete